MDGPGRLAGCVGKSGGVVSVSRSAEDTCVFTLLAGLGGRGGAGRGGPAAISARFGFGSKGGGGDMERVVERRGWVTFESATSDFGRGDGTGTSEGFGKGGGCLSFGKTVSEGSLSSDANDVEGGLVLSIVGIRGLGGRWLVSGKATSALGLGRGGGTVPSGGRFASRDEYLALSNAGGLGLGVCGWTSLGATSALGLGRGGGRVPSGGRFASRDEYLALSNAGGLGLGGCGWISLGAPSALGLGRGGGEGRFASEIDDTDDFLVALLRLGRRWFVSK